MGAHTLPFLGAQSLFLPSQEPNSSTHRSVIYLSLLKVNGFPFHRLRADRIEFKVYLACA